MKYFYSLLIICFVFTCHAQDKSDVLECLEQIFEHPEFKPAYDNSTLYRPDLIVLKRNKPFPTNQPLAISDIFFDMTNEDFYSFQARVEFATEPELEALHILEQSGLNIDANLNPEEIVFNITTLSNVRNLHYQWLYRFLKQDGEWRMIGNEVVTQKRPPINN